MARVMVTECAWHHFGLEEDILLFYGALPFGRGSSPGHFCRFSGAIDILHYLHGPSHLHAELGISVQIKNVHG